MSLPAENDIKGNISIVERSLEDISSDGIEGGPSHYMDELEILRRTLKTFMNPSTLRALNELSALLDQKPRDMEQYAKLSRRSEDGGQCKYAIGALMRFKRNRIDRVKDSLRKCLAELDKESDA